MVELSTRDKKQSAMQRRGRCWVAAASMLSSLLCMSSCGSGSTGPRQSVFDFEFILSSEVTDLEQAVVVDSVRWNSTAFDFLASGELEVIGPFEIHFRSVVDEALEMSYDLRFLDRDGFLFDRFIPFGLPVAFGPGQALIETGEFEIRSTQMRLDELRTMRIVASVRAADGE